MSHGSAQFGRSFAEPGACQGLGLDHEPPVGDVGHMLSHALHVELRIQEPEESGAIAALSYGVDGFL